MNNIDILSHFEETILDNGVVVFKLKETERNEFFSKLPKPFRLLYINEEDIIWRLDQFGKSRNEEILEMIPDEPVIMSGEFSEILCYYIIPERYLPDSNLRPPKWRWKESKNKAAHFTDVVLFCQKDLETPSTNDCLISIESKARASRPSSTESSLQKAIDDVQKDYVSRLGESFFYLKTRYKVDRDANSVRQLERFMDAAKYPTFKKHFKAIATVEDSFAEIHIKNITNIPTEIIDTFEIIIIRIQDLKNAYELTYTELANT